MDIVRLYNDYHIYYRTEGHKHCRPGWVNTECPFCEGNPGLHLGFNTHDEFFVCWRCGWKPTDKTIAKLLHVTQHEAKDIIRRYGGKTRVINSPEEKITINRKPLKFPPDTTDLQEQHKIYLRKRGFNPSKIQRLWGVKGVGPCSRLDNINYSHRILIPIYWEQRLVSFQTRDITGSHPAKYMACPKEREIINHKQIVYAQPDIWDEETVICVEGVFDAWKLGKKALATFGIKTKPEQRALLQRFNKVIIVFDNDPQAIKESHKIARELNFFGVKTEEITLNTDPGDLKQKDANSLIATLLQN